MMLESYGDKRPDASMCKHIARRMLPSLKLCSDHALLLPDLWSRIIEDLLRRAAHELELQRETGRRERGYEARPSRSRHGSGQPGREECCWGSGIWRARPRERTYCAHHGEGQSHNSPECIVMSREFERHYGEFQEYLQTRGLGTYAAGRGRGRGADGHYRQQQNQYDSGARWNRGHPPAERATSASTCLLYTSPSPRD